MLRRLILPILLCFALPLVCQGRSKHAVVIGLGEYQDKAWSKIHGDRDVLIVLKMLKDNGYTDVKSLVNSQATKSNITAAFSSLANRCKSGDIVYIHFSGHGQQVTDINGDEEDGFDEAWIPYDAEMKYSSKYKGEKHLIDDELAVWMSKIKKKIGKYGRLLVVVDACHSGDSLRKNDDEEEVYYRGTNDDFIIPLKTKPKRTKKQTENWVTLSACQDFQINCEVKTKSGGFYGMLSYAICYMSKDFNGLSNQRILSKLQQFVDRHRSRLPQDPVITGDGSNLSIFF